jgi:hypothetical protein
MADQIRDGGPAFPGTEYDSWDGVDIKRPGMALRDYFATHASEEDIQSFLPQTQGGMEDLVRALGWIDASVSSSRAILRTVVMRRRLRQWARYQHADNMLRAREVKA